MGAAPSGPEESNAKSATDIRKDYVKFKDLQLKAIRKVEAILNRHLEEISDQEGEDRKVTLDKIKALTKILYGVDCSGLDETSVMWKLHDIRMQLPSTDEYSDSLAFDTEKYHTGPTEEPIGPKTQYQTISERFSEFQTLPDNFPSSLCGNYFSACNDLIAVKPDQDIGDQFQNNYNDFNQLYVDAKTNDALHESKWGVVKVFESVLNGLGITSGALSKFSNLFRTKTVADVEQSHEDVLKSGVKPPGKK